MREACRSGVRHSQAPVPDDAILPRTGQAAAEVIKLNLKALDHSLQATRRPVRLSDCCSNNSAWACTSKDLEGLDS